MKQLIMITGLMAVLVFAGPAGVGAENVQVGTATHAIGTVIVVRSDGVQERLQGKGAIPLYEGDVVKTDPASQGAIVFQDGVKVSLNEETVFTIYSRWLKDQPLVRIIRMTRGEVWVNTGEGVHLFEVETPVATAAVEGTEFDLKVQDDGQSVLTVMSGVVKFGTAFGTCPIPAGKISYGVRGKKCTKPAPTDPAQTLSWTNALK